MSNVMLSATHGTPRHVAVKNLRLDPENPRLPESQRGGSQVDLALLMVMGFDAYAVAQSIADNGFFAGEPLLAVRSESEPGAYIVVEGNRRFTALLGLTDESVRSQLPDADRWKVVAERARMSQETLIPIVEHPDRASTHVEVARAHVVGKLAWRPYMQARFIAARVAEGNTIQQVAEMIGIPKSKAADLYRDQAVVTQAQSLGLATGEVEKAFSLLTVAMGVTRLRAHVSAPLGSQLEVGKDPIPAEKTDELSELLEWIFGSEDAEPKITDSRQAASLGNVAASEVGLAALRAGATLEEARQKVTAAGMDPRERLVNRLNTAKNSLLAAADDLSAYALDKQVVKMVEDVDAVFESLRSTLAEVDAEAAGSKDSSVAS